MDAAVPLGRLAGIWRYPVKSLACEPLAAAEFDEEGLRGDRAAALFVTTPERARSGKTLRGKEQPRFHTVRDADGARSVAGPALELELREAGPYFDAAPVSLVFDRWLEELEALCGVACEPLRFRPNLFARAGNALPGEAELSGARLRIGTTFLRVSQPIVRCVTPSYDLVTAQSSQELLRALVQKRNNLMGVYCTVERPGSVALDDALEVL